MNQVVVLIVFIVIVDKVSEMVLASGSSMAVVLDLRFEVLAAELEAGFTGFDDFLAGHVHFGVLFLNFLFVNWFVVILTHDTFVGRVV